MSKTPEEMKEYMQRCTPDARLREHQEYWGDKAPESVKQFISKAQKTGKPDTRLVLISKLDHLRVIDEWNRDPDTIRGEKQVIDASKGGKAAAKWTERKGELQAAVDEVYARHPDWGYEDIKRQVIKDNNDYNPSALKRHTTNPCK